MEILEAIWTTWGNAQCGGMNQFTVAIAGVRNEEDQQWIAIAANVDFRKADPSLNAPTIGLGSEAPPDDFTNMIMTILLKYGLLPDAPTQIVVLKNPLDNEHMQRHAEMQLTRWVKYKLHISYTLQIFSGML